MKQKYQILRDGTDTIIIREFAELDREMMSLLCEERYDVSKLEDAREKGKEILVSVLRTKNLYPIGAYAEKIAEEVSRLLDSDDNEPRELFFDDLELVAGDDELTEDLDEELEVEKPEIDDLLEDDVDDEFDEEIDVGKIKTSIRVAEDEPDLEDEL